MTTHSKSPFHPRERLSYKQAKYTVLIAVGLGMLSSCLQIYWDFSQQTKDLEQTVGQILNIVEQTASQAAYSLDKEFASEIINGLFEYKPIYEASITDDAGNMMAHIQGGKDEGSYRLITDLIFGDKKSFTIPLTILPPPVSFSDIGKIINVGILNVEIDTYPTGLNFLKRAMVLFFSEMIQNLFLSCILLIFFHYFLTKPFINLERSLLKVDIDTPETSLLKPPKHHTRDEFSMVISTTNNLLVAIQKNITERIRRVSEAERMKGEISERKRREEEMRQMHKQLEESNTELSFTLDSLKETQSNLIQSEKMAALGKLTASLAHEINTPLGIGVSGATHLNDEFSTYKKQLETGEILKEDFEEFLDTGQEISELIVSNLRKTYGLIKSYKQVAVDQTSESKRLFNVKEYIEKILVHLGNTIKKAGHTFTINCDQHLKLESYPGAFSQIIDNLILNSIAHAFEKGEKGKIEIDVINDDTCVTLKYSDNGKGIPKEILGKIYEPFFTTKHDEGGTGLGLHVIYSIVVNRFSGTIECESELGKGTTFVITLPKEPPDNQNVSTT